MKRAINYIFGFILGGVIGATLILLLTPSSGDEIRSQLQERFQGIQQEVTAAAQTRRAELEQQLAALRKP